MTTADLDRIATETGHDFIGGWSHGSQAINSFLRGCLGMGIWVAVGLAVVLNVAYGRLDERKA